MKLEIPDKKKLVHQLVMPIRWGDMDAMGHVNNTIYFRYMEVVRLDWLRELGETLGPKTEVGLIIVNAFCNFQKQFEFPGDILAKLYVSDLGRTSFDSWTTMERTDDPGVICASGGSTIVWADYTKQKSVPLPEWMRKIVE